MFERFFSSFKKRSSGRINRFRHTTEKKKHNKKRKETVCFVRGVFSFFIELVCGPQKPLFLGSTKNHEKKTRAALKKSRKHEVKISPREGKKRQKRQKKKGKTKKKDATIEFFGDARADGRRNNQYRPKKEERRARRKKRRTFR